MHGMRDAELLKEYLQRGSESAFTELVKRYVDLAFSVARRQLGDQHLAEEVVQMVFCLLVRKARGLTQYESLAGWVHRASYNISLKTLRDERKRRDRTRAIADMPDGTLPGSSEDSWEELVPYLDEAFTQLPDSDRGVLVLRFIQNKGMREVGQALGTTEAAAKMRVGRAIERIRKYFQSRGISSSSASLTAALSALSADAAPVGLSGSVIAVLLSNSSTHATSAWSLAKTLMFMANLKTKLVFLGLGAAAVLMTGSYLLDRSLKSVPQTSGDKASAPAGDRPVLLNQKNPSETSGLRDRMAAQLRETSLARARARLQSALEAPPRKGTRSYPSEAVENAMADFGPYHAEAFEILKATIEAGEPEARLQAIAALGRVGKNVPDARAQLWRLLKDSDDHVQSLALMALGNSGIQPEDIATLAQLIPDQTNQQLIRYLPESIARAIQRDPEAMKPHLGPVEGLLHHEDSAVRFSAACALAELRGPQDPQILKTLAAGLAVSDEDGRPSEATGEAVRHLMAIETLQRMGPAAKAVLQELKAFANTTPDPVIREVALRAIGTIDPEAVAKHAEVHAVISKDEQRNSLFERLQAGTFSSEDLSQGLKEPFTTRLAASVLGELGPGAQSSLPELDKALAGKDEATREEILAAMRKIDPNHVVERVDRTPVAQGALAAQIELETQRSQGELNTATAASLEQLIDRFRIGNTSWYTRGEVAEFAEQLQKANPVLWNVFVAKATEVDSEFTKALPPGAK